MSDKIEVTQADRECARNIRNAWDVSCDTAFEIAAQHRILATRTDATPVAWMPIDSASPFRSFVTRQRSHADICGSGPVTHHKMERSRLNHGNTQCVYCLATDLEILHALGPVCPNAPSGAVEPVTAVERFLAYNIPKPIDVGAMVERLLWHVEQCLGPISKETCEVAGDDDYSILRHNFKCVLSMNDADYNARIERACTIPSGDDWNTRFLLALDREGLMLVMKWDLSKTDNRYPWPGTPICAPIPFGEDGPTWPRGSYIVFKP